MFDQRGNKRFKRPSDLARCFCPAVLVILLLAAIAGCAKTPAKMPVVESGGEVLIGVNVDADGRMAVFRVIVGIGYILKNKHELASSISHVCHSKL